MRPVAPFLSDNTNPAGGIMSGAEDMAKWVMVQLDSGRTADGSRLFSPASARQLWREVTPTPIYDPPPGLAQLQPKIERLRARPGDEGLPREAAAHAHGRAPGLRLARGHDPRAPARRRGAHQPGVGRSPSTPSPIGCSTTTSGVKAPDYVGIYERVLAQNRAQLAQLHGGGREPARLDGGTVAPARAKYAGTYRDIWYGDVAITQENGGLVIRMTKTPSMVGDLVHWQYDTFVARWRDRELRADAYVTFALTPAGTIDQVKMAADLAGRGLQLRLPGPAASPRPESGEAPRTDPRLAAEPSGGDSPTRQPLRSYDAAE